LNIIAFFAVGNQIYKKVHNLIKETAILDKHNPFAECIIIGERKYAIKTGCVAYAFAGAN
jgi:hypothetical protein